MKQSRIHHADLSPRHAAIRSQILLAEDDPELRKLIAWTIEQEGYEVTECPDGKVLQKQLLGSGGKTSIFDLVISDIRMPGLSGLEVLEKARAQGLLPPTILITAFPDRKTREKVRQLGPHLLAKPFEMDDLLDLVSTMMPTAFPNGKPSPGETTILRFPLDTTFRSVSERRFYNFVIRKAAERLNRYGDHIEKCRVIAESRSGHHGTRHLIAIHLEMESGAVLVKHDSDVGEVRQDLLLAIHTAFGIAGRRLKKHLRRSRP